MSAPLKYVDVDPKSRVNKMFTYVLVCMNILSPLFILLNTGSVYFDNQFTISVFFSTILACIVFPLSFVQYLLVFKIKKQNVARYFGVISAMCIIGYLQCYFDYDFSLLWGLICFLSCLYYSVRFSIGAVLISYMVSCISSTWRLFFEFYLDAEVNLKMIFLKNFIITSSEFFLIFVVVFSISIIVSLDRRISDAKTIALKNARLSISAFSLKVMESHDGITNIHALHASKYCELICRGLFNAGLYTDVLTDETINLYAEAAIQHDVGKVHIPSEILHKTEALTPEESELMKTHTIEGRKILEGLPKVKGGEYNDIVSQMAFYHHEMYNGEGYPLGISGKSIPLCARIMCAAENLDSLLNWRMSKTPLTVNEVMDYFENEKGRKFDPEIADVVISLKDKIEALKKVFKEEELEKKASFG